MRIQVNATAETQPAGNITVAVTLINQTNVYMEYFNLSFFGFLNGTNKILMSNITDSNLPLSTVPKEYNSTFSVAEQVWGVTYGEFSVTYRVDVGSVEERRFSNITCGFIMTNVKNVYLEGLEQQLNSMSAKYQQLNTTYWNLHDLYWELSSTYLQLNQTYWELNRNYTSLQGRVDELERNYTSLQGRLDELDNTRRALVVLAITTVFFVATTFYLVMRRPRQQW